MDATNQHIAKFSRLIFFIVAALTLCSHPSFCEESEIGVNEEITDKQYKSYINEFQSVFGKQMEREFNLTLIVGGFLHDFSIDTIEFYAYRRATVEEARALELSVLNKLAEEIRADSKMLSYLNRLSLTPESIGVDIRFVNLQRWGYDDGSIDNVYSKTDKNDFRKRYLRYTTTDPFSDYSDNDDEAFSTRFEESFEDAVKLNAATSIINPAIHESTGFENELDQILTSFKEEMNEKHGLLFRPSGWMVAGKSTFDISEIRTKCIYLYPVSCQEARALILLATEKLLTALNNSETLRPYLKEYPISASRLKLRMLFRKYKYFVGHVPYYDGSMESAVLNGNAITYYHHIPNIEDSSMHDRVVYAKESYQEAQKTFENTPPLTPLEKITKEIKNFIFTFSKFLDFVFFIFFLVLLFIISTNSWLFIIPIIVGLIFILRRRRRPSQ
jgi:hypothetical protein